MLNRYKIPPAVLIHSARMLLNVIHANPNWTYSQSVDWAMQGIDESFELNAADSEMVRETLRTISTAHLIAIGNP